MSWWWLLPLVLAALAAVALAWMVGRLRREADALRGEGATLHRATQARSEVPSASWEAPPATGETPSRHRRITW